MSFWARVIGSQSSIVGLILLAGFLLACRLKPVRRRRVLATTLMVLGGASMALGITLAFCDAKSEDAYLALLAAKGSAHRTTLAMPAVENGSGSANEKPTPAAIVMPDALKAGLKDLQTQAENIAASKDPHEVAKLWLSLNRKAIDFAAKMDDAYPNTEFNGNQLEPAEAEEIAGEASASGVKIDFCEIGSSWSAGNEGYLQYLELWPGGPDAGEATWKGPMENGVCGDSDAPTDEEVRQIVNQYQQFIDKFPHSRFVAEAKERIRNAREFEAAKH